VEKATLGWGRLVAMLMRSTNLVSDEVLEGRKPRKALFFKMDKKSIFQSELSKAFLKTDGTKLECL